MYLFCPMGNYNKARQKAYSNFLQSVKSVGATIFINSLILSEFSNRYLRMDFEQWKKEQGVPDLDFKKHFIGTDRYKDTVTEIRQNVKAIMKICEKMSDNFNAINLDNVFTHLTEIDFNDSYYIEFVPLIRAKLVTDDSDFIRYKNHDLEVVTFK